MDFLWVKIKYGWIRRIFDEMGSLYINQVDIHVEKKIPPSGLRPYGRKSLNTICFSFCFWFNLSLSLSLSLFCTVHKIIIIIIRDYMDKKKVIVEQFFSPYLLTYGRSQEGGIFFSTCIST